MENANLDPRDLNGDGKVTIDEKVKYAATKAGEKLKEVAGEAKEGAKKLFDQAKSKIDSLTQKKSEGEA